MRHIGRDFRHALRGLRRAPFFAGLAVMSLGLGIGANTAIFTLVDQVLLRPLPVEEPHDLVRFELDGAFHGANWGLGTSVSYPMYEEFRDSLEPVFSGMFSKFDWSMHVGAARETELVAGELVSGTYFPVLGVRPALGRLFTPDDDRAPGGHSVAVLSYRYWQAQFAGEASVIGRKITINDHPFTIIGVTEAGFDGLDVGSTARIFVPMMMKAQMTPGWNFLDDERGRFAQVFARLRSGVTREEAEASLQPVFRALRQRELADPELAGMSDQSKRRFVESAIELVPGFQGYSWLRSQLTRPLYLLLVIAAGVLLIACANVAALLVARGMGRQREVAIRLAIGASRWRVVQQLLAESLVLASCGAVLGVLISIWGAPLLLGLLVDPDASVSVSASPDGRVLGFTFTIALVTGILFGLVPALQTTRPDLAPALKDQTRGASAGGQVRLRKALVMGQVALSLLLLTGAGLFVRSLQNLLTQDPGFTATNLLSFDLEGSLSGYSGDRARQFYRSLVERLSAVPGVIDVALTLNVPLREGWNSTMGIEGYDAKESRPPVIYNDAVTPGYFQTMRIPLLAGRDFSFRDTTPLATPAERTSALAWIDDFRVAIANQRFVDMYVKDRHPIGRHVGFDDEPKAEKPIEIVGVVGNARTTGIREDPRPQLFFPFLEIADPMRASVHVRTMQAPETMFPLLRHTLRAMAPDLPLVRMRTMDEQVARSLSNERLVAGLSSVFGLLATLLAVVGLYGVMAYAVTRRTREIGIRMALGALGRRVAWLFLREAMLLVALGFTAALPIMWMLARYVQSQLYGVEPLDPATIVLAMLGLGAVTVAGALVPAMKAARVHPLAALREE